MADSPAPDEWTPLARRALAHWELNLASARLASHSENVVLEVRADNGERFVLRFHRPGYNSPAALASEGVWTAALRDAGLNVPATVALPGGDCHIPVEMPDGAVCMTGLVRWIDGTPLRTLARRDDPDSLLRHMHTLGTLAAEIHNQSSRWTPPPDFTRHRLDAAGLMGMNPRWGPFWILPEMTPAECAELLRLRGLLFDWLKARSTDAGSFSMIHADLHAGNLMAAGDHLTIIDFDDAGFGWHLYELAVMLFDNEHTAGAPDATAAVVTGYRQRRPLTDAQVDDIAVFKLIRCLAILGWIHARRELAEDNIRPLIADSLSRSEALGFR